jgi:acyl-CoA dehydrogenase
VDKAVQAFGAAGVTQDFILAELTAHARILRIVDGPDEVHRETIARRELSRSVPREGVLA